jgi:predicted kinase
LDWPVFSSDEIRKTLASVPLTQRTPPELRNKIYSPQMTQKTYRKLLKEGLAAIDYGNRGVILDATFSTRALRKFLQDECKKANVVIQFIELEVDPNEIKNRLKLRDEKTAEMSDARLGDFEKLNAAYQPPSELGPDLISVSTTSSVSDTVKAMLLRLAEKQSIVTNNK